MSDTLKTSTINDFIGIFDGYITDRACNEAIELFKHHEAFDKVYSRLDIEDSPQNEKNDTSLMITPECIRNIDIDLYRIKPIMVSFNEALEKYYEVTGIKQYIGENLKIDYCKIQKTLPSQGYHLWHIEKGCDKESLSRALAFTIYLNDVEEGGETEFLIQSKRVKPKKGRIAIWPAGFPYVHRGNPPLDGEKFIITAWISYRCQN
ncbi:2OG-Fe(II) oxygenase [Aequorivita sinensis]|uniref:2OG-Fe(II) oxygenase n=1 Tax=Aequorivita sinensis TaxID=1382458 RepID=UPI002300629F|nr:2OG-Fe(II) oxygenase [Aequorivita sinensis]